MNVLITGGAGFIGSHLAEELLERDVKNVLQYFKKHGISQTKEEVLKKIRGN